MFDLPPLRADCARCAALCCVALAFDRSESFAIDKPAGEPCPNLDDAGMCSIHADRERAGFGGCIQYECTGAGQRVTQELFGGRGWRDDRRLLAPMMRAFSAMHRVHRLLELLAAAEALPLDAGERQTLSTFVDRLNPPEGWSEQSLADFPLETAANEVGRFLHSLQRHVAVE